MKKRPEEIEVKYVVVSPVRNEEKYIEKTILSLITQSVLPRQWIIVDDGSSDKTFQIVSDYERKYDFITAIRKPDKHWDNVHGDVRKSLRRKDRLAWAAEAKAFNYGLKFIKEPDYDFVAKLDGDVSFGNDYFEKIFSWFFDNPRLGIAGGHCYQLRKGKLKLEKVPDSHVRGATKVYRKKCFLEIGGIQEVLGWDTIDELKAQIKGWETQSFREPKLIHHRPTGSVTGILRGKVRHGETAYYLGYHPLFMMLRGFRRVTDQPLLIGSLALFFGFLKGYFTNSKRFDDKEFKAYLRKQQLDRLLFKKWREENVF